MATPMVNPHTKNGGDLNWILTLLNIYIVKQGCIPMSMLSTQSSHPWFFLYQDVGCNEFSSIPLLLNARYALFDAINYDNRFMHNERDVLYAFSVPMYYGQGMVICKCCLCLSLNLFGMQNLHILGMTEMR